jgi:Flp pilus assembly pilin Flp
MKLLNIFKSFKSDESGAVTVDWVVLTAAIVGLGMVVMVAVGGGIQGLGNSIVDDLGERASATRTRPRTDPHIADHRQGRVPQGRGLRLFALRGAPGP